MAKEGHLGPGGVTMAGRTASRGRSRQPDVSIHQGAGEGGDETRVSRDGGVWTGPWVSVWVASVCGVCQGALELEGALSQRLRTPLTLNLSLLLQRAKEKPGRARHSFGCRFPTRTMSQVRPEHVPTQGLQGLLTQEPFVSTLTSAQGRTRPLCWRQWDSPSGPSPHKAVLL